MPDGTFRVVNSNGLYRLLRYAFEIFNGVVKCDLGLDHSGEKSPLRQPQQHMLLLAE